MELKVATERVTRYFHKELLFHVSGERLLNDRDLSSAVAHWLSGYRQYRWQDDYAGELVKQRQDLIDWGLIDAN